MSVQESLVIQTSFLGDTVLTTPLIAELAARGPVDVVTTPAATPLLANNPDIRSLVVYDKRGADRGLGGMRRVARRIPRTPGTRRVAYLAQGSMRSGALALLAGCEERVGFATSAGRMLYTRRVTHRDDRHHAERLWRLAFAEEPGVEPTPVQIRPRLFPGDAERAEVDELLGAMNLAPHDDTGPHAPPAIGARTRAALDARPLVALAPGSVWGTKRWPYYPELAERFAERARIIVLGSTADAELARAIVERVPAGSAIDATGRLSLLASAEAIGRSALLVTNDSLPQHLASAMGTPTVTLFGPTVPEFGFGPLAPRSMTLGVDGLACRPCHHHGPARCPLGHWRCMRELAVSDVERMVATIATGA